MQQMTHPGRAFGVWLLVLILLVALAAAAWWVWSRSAGDLHQVSAMNSLLENADLDADQASSGALWNLNARLETQDAERFALSLSLIRLDGLTAEAAKDRNSDLAAEGFMIGRLVLIPIDDQEHLASQRFQHLNGARETHLESIRMSRIAAGLAGPASLEAEGQVPAARALIHTTQSTGNGVSIPGSAPTPEMLPPALWVESIRFERQREGRWQLSAREPDFELELQLESLHPVLHLSELLDPGRNSGLGTVAGQESDTGIRGEWLPRLGLEGEIRWAGKRLPITGSGWLEAASGPVATLLSEGSGQLVSDRFLLQLDQGDSLLCLRVRRRGGGGVPLNQCVLVSPESGIRRFDRREVRLEPTEEDDWLSPITAARYPLRWTLGLPGRNLQLAPVRLDRELPLSTPFWSGPMVVFDDQGQTLGHGRMDLVGIQDNLAPDARMGSSEGSER